MINTEDFERELIERGYIKYKPSPFKDDCVTDSFQKVIKDDSNKRKYFVDWDKWDFSRYVDANHPDLNNPAFEGSTQLTTKDGEVVDITLHAGWGIKKAEEFLAKLFDTGWFKLYDNDY